MTPPLPFGQGGRMEIWAGQIIIRPGARKNRKKTAMWASSGGHCSPVVLIKQDCDLCGLTTLRAMCITLTWGRISSIFQAPQTYSFSMKHLVFIWSVVAVTWIFNSKNYPLWCSFYSLSMHLDKVIAGSWMTWMWKAEVYLYNPNNNSGKN